MRRKVLKYVISHKAGDDLELISFREEGNHVIEGVLQQKDGYWYPILRGVPCFLRSSLRPDLKDFKEKHGLPSVPEEDGSSAQSFQKLTNVTFSDKWRRFRNYGMEPSHQEFLMDWYCKKLGLDNVEELKRFYRNRDMILEVGPGSGFNSRFMAEHTRGQVVAADISDAAYTTFENTHDLPNCHVIQADLMNLPVSDWLFDFIIADGVLHHTPDTQQAVFALYRKLKPGGQFFFHVYKKMGPARQFCDQHIRARFSKLAPDVCYEACEGLTELGRELSKLGAKVTLEKGVPVLGIPSGTHDVQRLLYYNFLKCFWNDAFDFETNNMVNFDWYHPHNAWQHTEDEVRDWLKELGVKEYEFHPANPNGISVLLSKPS
jgi:SAM-dependent methyltransferase/uncharacterized protein YbaR (Trm112 family)